MQKRYFYLVSFIVFVFFFDANAQNQPFQFRVSYEETTNLIYQLDCLNNLTNCGKDDYQALWEKEFFKTSEDRKILGDWAKIRNRYSGRILIDQAVKYPLDRRQNGINLYDKIMVAGLQAKSLEDYLTRLDLLVIPREREEFEKIVRHFQPRFSVWWENAAKEKGLIFAAQTNELLKSSAISENIAKFRNFYEPYLPKDYVITFDLFFRPNLAKSGSSGRALENRMIVEFLPDEKPERRIGVVLHEFCHFMFNNIEPEKQIEFQNAFLQTGRKSVVPAFNLLNETLATVFGNGIIQRSLVKSDTWQKYLAIDRSFYFDSNIDKAAKAVLPLMDEWLAKGGKMNDPQFVANYLDTLEKTFGERLLSPQLYLGQAFMFVDEKFDPSIRGSYQQIMKTASLSSRQGNINGANFEEYFSSPNLSAVFIVQPQNAEHLASKKVISARDFKEIRQAVKAEKKILYAIKRGENAYTFIIIAENNDAAKELLTNLAASPQAFTGRHIK